MRGRAAPSRTVQCGTRFADGESLTFVYYQFRIPLRVIMDTMRAELLSIGSELTQGHTMNTNASDLSRRLAELGIVCVRQTTVADDRAAIVESLKAAVARSQLVITTGGLGPTMDDLTVEAIAEATGRRLVVAPRVARTIRAFYRAHRRRMNRLALRQAAVPVGTIVLPNPVGTAPGLWLALDGSLLVALPGVPQEMRAIMERSVLPRLKTWAEGFPVMSRTIRTVGLVELSIQTALQRLSIPPSVQVGLYPHLMAVDVRLTVTGTPHAAARRILDRLEHALRRRLGPAVYGIDNERLEEVVGRALVRRHKTLAVAESCTGGLVSDRITNVPGSSRYFLLSVVAYENRMKQVFLGVSPSLLSRYGAVSAPVARAMATGVRKLAGVDFGLAITGIAGPGGGTSKKPVGLVYLALADRTQAAVKRVVFHGDRRSIKSQMAQAALDGLRRWALGLN